MPPFPKISDIRLLIFDLDGTLIDSERDLALSVNHMRGAMGLGPLEDSLIFSYVGQGAPVLVRRALAEPGREENVQKGLEIFLAYYGQHMLDNTRTYAGVREALEELNGRSLAVLTNKPVVFSKKILEGLGIAHHFEFVYGGNSFDEKKPHPVGVFKLMQDLGAAPRQTMMVGDSDTDVETGRAAGTWTCGVRYGFGSHTLEATPPDILLDDLRQLPALLNAGRPAKQGA